MNFYYMKSQGLALFIAATIIGMLISCQDQVTPTFTTPSTYRYNSPQLETTEIFEYGLGTYIPFISNENKFGIDNESNSDSINRIVNLEFLKSGAVTQLNFSGPAIVQVTVAKLDTVNKANTFIVNKIVSSGYRFEGNKLKIDSFPDRRWEIDNDFYEIRECYYFSEQSWKVNDTLRARVFDYSLCNSIDKVDYIKKVSTNRGRIFDTVAVHLVDLIFTKY
jgi:hypothetical protein